MVAAAPSITEYLIADNLAYAEGTMHEATSTNATQSQLIADLQHNMAIEQQSTGINVSGWSIVNVQFIPKDGFYGVAFAALHPPRPSPPRRSFTSIA